jgi:hypothetical protein
MRRSPKNSQKTNGRECDSASSYDNHKYMEVIFFLVYTVIEQAIAGRIITSHFWPNKSTTNV